MKLCKDCKHHISHITEYKIGQNSETLFDLCNRANNTKQDISKIDGSVIGHLTYCEYERDSPFPIYYLFGDCGSNARFFEDK